MSQIKKQKRVLVKFQDLDDREAVYQARFDQKQDRDDNKIIIHENLTQIRANMIKQLGQMREKGSVVNYHTKNGMIYARNSRVEVFTGQIFGPNSNPPHLVGSKSIPPQIQKLMGHPYQSI